MRQWYSVRDICERAKLLKSSSIDLAQFFAHLRQSSAATRQCTAVLYQARSSIEKLACTLVQNDGEKETKLSILGLHGLCLRE